MIPCTKLYKTNDDIYLIQLYLKYSHLRNVSCLISKKKDTKQSRKKNKNYIK